MTRTTHTNLEVLQETRIDDFLECRCGSKFVRFMDRIHEVHIIERKNSQRIFVVRERLTEIQAITRPDYFAA